MYACVARAALSAAVPAAAFLFLVAPASGGLVLEIKPGEPTVDTPVTVEAWRWFMESSYRETNTTYVLSQFHIGVEVYVVKDPIGLPVETQVGGTAHLGLLPAGRYEVDADMYLQANPMLPAFEHYDSGSTSFEVTPDPATLALLAVGGAGLLASRRRRHAA